LDSQSVEIIGRARLVEQLLLGRVEVALPARDRGIDLIAYLDLDATFIACPIQMKAATGRAFSINAKYGKFPNLIHAFVWNIGSSAEIFALNQREAIAVADEMGYTKTYSWLAGDYYTSTKVGKGLLALIERFRMTPELWHAKISTAMVPR
jgi:hypothetical protein